MVFSIVPTSNAILLESDRIGCKKPWVGRVTIGRYLLASVEC